VEKNQPVAKSSLLEFIFFIEIESSYLLASETKPNKKNLYNSSKKKKEERRR
jgi:hypothetical protein